MTTWHPTNKYTDILLKNVPSKLQNVPYSLRPGEDAANVTKRMAMAVTRARPHSNDHVIAGTDGRVTRARAIARVPLEKSWDPDMDPKSIGTPDSPLASLATDDDALLEEHHGPHHDADHELREKLAREDANSGTTSAGYIRYRITNYGIKEYGPAAPCHRCTRLKLGDARTSIKQSEECSKRVYSEMRTNKCKRCMEALRCSPGPVKRQTIVEHRKLREEEYDE